MKVAIIGHKQIDITPTLTENLYAYLNQSIINKKVINRSIKTIYRFLSIYVN